MTYELALELKNAGFPQAPAIDISGIDGRFFGSFYYIVKVGIDEVAPNFLNEFEWEAKGQVHSDKQIETIKIPILSELIEACSISTGGFQELRAPKETCEGDEWGVTCGWVASGYPYPMIPDGLVEDHLVKVIGTSPEEAVAKLWLELKRGENR